MRPAIAAAVGIMVALLAPRLSAATPMRVAILVDTSAGTASAIVQIRSGVQAFLEALPAEHEVLLVTTGRRTQVRVPPTMDRSKLKDSAAGLLSETGPTPLMDALIEVDERFMRKAADRWPVFLVITGDGAESSKPGDDQAFNRWIADIARRGVSANAVVLKISGNGLPKPSPTQSSSRRAAITVMSNGARIPEAMKQLAEQLSPPTPRSGHERPSAVTDGGSRSPCRSLTSDRAAKKKPRRRRKCREARHAMKARRSAVCLSLFTVALCACHSHEHNPRPLKALPRRVRAGTSSPLGIRFNGRHVGLSKGVRRRWQHGRHGASDD